MTKRVFLKLLILLLVVIGVSTTALDLLVRRNWEHSLLAQLNQDLRDKTQMFASRVEHERGIMPFQQLAKAGQNF